MVREIGVGEGTGAKTSNPGRWLSWEPRAADSASGESLQDRLQLKMWQDRLIIMWAICCHYRPSCWAKGLLIRKKPWKMESEPGNPWPSLKGCGGWAESKMILSLEGAMFFTKGFQRVLHKGYKVQTVLFSTHEVCMWTSTAFFQQENNKRSAW